MHEADVVHLDALLPTMSLSQIAAGDLPSADAAAGLKTAGTIGPGAIRRKRIARYRLSGKISLIPLDH